MFDISFSELLVIAVVALLVLGPERLPKAARFAGLWLRKARAQWYSVKSEFEREMAADELKRSLGNPVQDLRREVEDAGRELDGAVREAETLARAGQPAAPVETPPEAPAAASSSERAPTMPPPSAAGEPAVTTAAPARSDPPPP